MAIKYGFFNSVNNDRLYNADDISNYFVKLISDGVFATPSNAMQVAASSGMTVNVSAGWGFIACRWLNNTAAYSLTLDAADSSLDRIDRVVMRLDRENRLMTFAVIKGTASATPSAPALTRTDSGIYELSLAQISVAANTSAITQADITDERADTDVCGYVTGLIDQIDTTDLFAQYNAAFTEFLDSARTGLNYFNLTAQYTAVYTTTNAGEDTITIPLNDYNSALDILNIYINGIRLIKGVDYTATSTAITLTTPIELAGTPVLFECLKSVDTSGAANVAALVAQLQNRVNTVEQAQGGISMRKLTQAEYDAMESHNASTLYIVLDTEEEEVSK